MKKIIIYIFLLASISASAQTLTKKWRTDTLLRVPESVLWDTKNKVLYVACIDGKSDVKDGIGSIAKVGADGKIIAASWVPGLNAPKGMGLYNNTLYVADVNEVAVIDINSGKITTRIPLEGSQFLNDVTIDSKGDVFVSDSNSGKIWKITNNKPAVYFESPELKKPNGLLALKDGLYVLDFGSGDNFILSKDKKLVKNGANVPSADGVVAVGDHEYLVSNWNGEIWLVDAQGKTKKLVDTKDQKLSSADIWFDAASKTLYVPTFYSNSVIAYTYGK